MVRCAEEEGTPWHCCPSRIPSLNSVCSINIHATRSDRVPLLLVLIPESGIYIPATKQLSSVVLYTGSTRTMVDYGRTRYVRTTVIWPYYTYGSSIERSPRVIPATFRGPTNFHSGHALFVLPNPNLRRCVGVRVHLFPGSWSRLHQVVGSATSSHHRRAPVSRARGESSLPRCRRYTRMTFATKSGETRMLLGECWWCWTTTRQGRRPCTAYRYWRSGLSKSLSKRCADRSRLVFTCLQASCTYTRTILLEYGVNHRPPRL